MGRLVAESSSERVFERWFFAVFLLAALISPPIAHSFGVGTRAPDYVATDLVSKKSVKLSELRGRVVLIYLWREVCPLCLDEAKEFDRAAKVYGRRKVRSLIIIERGNDLEIEMESEIYQPVSAMINDPNGRFGRLYKVKGYPLFLVIDAGGRLRYRGPLLRGRALTKLVDQLITEKTPE